MYEFYGIIKIQLVRLDFLIRDVSQRVEALKKLQQSEKNSQELIEKMRRIDENKDEWHWDIARIKS